MTEPSQSPSDLVAERIKKTRQKRGFTTTKALAQRCAEIGAPQLTAPVLMNIESGRRDDAGRRRRNITVDELLALSLALNVSPLSLLTPKDDLATVDVTPSLTLEGEALGKWIAGREPEFAGVPPFDTEDSDTFQWEADLPAWRRVEILDERLQRDAEIRKSFRRTDALRAEIERRIEAGELPADVHTAWKWRATTDSWTLTSPSGECVEIPRPESED